MLATNAGRSFERVAIIVKSVAVSNAPDDQAGRADRQVPGDERAGRRDQPGRAGTSGAPAGLSGAEARAFGIAWLVAMGIACMVIGINILSRVQEAPSGLAAALIDELSSAGALTFAFLVPGGVALWRRRRRPAAVLMLAVLAAGLAVFTLIHIGGCVLIRGLLYPGILHRDYEFDLLGREALFEVGKDVIAYAASATGFVVILAWRLAPGPPVIASPAPITTFDILDGPRLVRAVVGDILAVRSAGNYAEFLLSDGRRLLMRTSLGAVQSALAPAGLVRTHRSWLVNTGRVTGLRPEGSGDYAVELGGVEAPLSRRFPQALAALRG